MPVLSTKFMLSGRIDPPPPPPPGHRKQKKPGPNRIKMFKIAEMTGYVWDFSIYCGNR